jgi:signal transduction histidine kinase
MPHDARPRRPWTATIGAIVGAAVVLGLVALLALGLDLRREVDRSGAPLAAAADRAAAQVDPARPARAAAALRDTGYSARLIGPGGRVRVQTGPVGDVWSRGEAGTAGALATAGADGWTLRDGAVEATRTLPSGATIVLRERLAPGAGTIGSAGPPVGAAVAVLALLAGALAWIVGTRRERRLARLTAAAQALGGGRPAPIRAEGRGGWRALSGAMESAAERAGVLQASAEARMEALGAALAPMAHAVAARTPSGGLIRNDALVRLADGLNLQDANALDAAVSIGLASSGPVSRRLTLTDGRALEVEGWSVPGGRVVAVGERTEQARMAVVRRQVTGAAARHLQAPVSEIQALGSDLMGQVPSSAVGTVRRIQAAADRMERLVAQLLRGTPNDPRAHPLRLRPVGAGGIAYGLGTAFDRRLRDRGLRLETDLPSDLPPMRTDAALVHEILSHLIANSATYTPRGGTITLSGRALPGGTVELAVTDTGPGIAGAEIHGITERFARGATAAGLPGAGLGLGVATALAERLGGRLTVEAGPGGKARLELPAALASPAAVREGDLSPEPAAAP